MEEVKLYPAWKQAVKTLIESGLTYGGTVDKERIIDLCELQRPRTLEQKDQFDLRLMSCICEIKDALLMNHQMLLATNRDGSYRVLHPKDQTQYAVEQGAKTISREMQRMAVSVENVNVGLLTSEQRRKNSDALAKMSMLAGMQRIAHNELASITSAPEMQAA